MARYELFVTLGFSEATEDLFVIVTGVLAMAVFRQRSKVADLNVCTGMG